MRAHIRMYCSKCVEDTMMQPDFVETYLAIKEEVPDRGRRTGAGIYGEYRSRRAGTDAEGSEAAEKKPGLSVRWMISERGIRP